MARIDLPEGSGPDVLRALSLVPHFGDAVAAKEAAVAKSPLDRRIHELIRMRIAEINGCTLCMAWRNDWADEESLADVSAYRTSTHFSAADRVAIEFAERFATESSAIDDELFARLHRHFTDAEIVDLTLVAGKYLAMGRFMQVFDLDQACALPLPGDKRPVDALPTG